MKKLISIILSIALILTAAAAVAEGNDSLNEIKTRGYLIVGTEGTWSPYTYHDEEEKLVGFDVEVAKLIADYIGVDVQYSETVWSSIFGSLDAGQIDLVVNEVSYTEERAVKYDFSIPYTFTQRAILVKADNDAINGLGDIAGKIASNDPTSSIGQFAINTTVAFADYLKQHPESEALVKIIVVTDPAPTGHVPVLKGNEQLLNAVNEALKKAQEDGTLSELSLKYFGIDITKE